MSEPTNTTIAENLRETYNLLKAPESEQRFIQAKLWMELAERTSAAEAERDKYKENLHDAEGRYLACYNELVKVQAERDALTEQVRVLREALDWAECGGFDAIHPWLDAACAALAATAPKEEPPCEK